MLSELSFLSVTHPCPCTLEQAQIDIGRFSPHPLCDIDILSPSNCIHKPGAIHCVRADTPRYFILITNVEELASTNSIVNLGHPHANPYHI